VPPIAFVFALTAAVLHATWNLMLARIRDNDAALGVAMVVGPLALLPIALTRWRMDAGALPYVALSSLFELAYFALLASSYRRAELSLVYPIARGLAPVFVLIGSVLFLGAVPGPIAVLGILTVAVGVLLVRGIRAPAKLADVLVAGTIAVTISGYTLIDQQGLHHADTLSYLVLVVLIPGSIYLAFVASRGGWARVRRAATPQVLGGGIAVVSAYGFVLAALTLAPAASVAAVREVSIVIATGLAAFVLHEHVSRARLLGSVVVFAGIALVVAS
jgi:drug/metabolite transporter (DMT)-like permease